MTEVRRHTRRTASGRTVNVRRHERDTGSGGGDRQVERPADVQAQPVSSLPPAVPPPADDAKPDPADWWADDGDEGYDWAEHADWRETEDGRELLPAAPSFPFGRREPEVAEMEQEMRDWRSLPEPAPPPAEPMTPQMAALLGCDTPEGRAKFDRLSAYRAAGYTGPLDQDNRIPDPDDPANADAIGALARMRRG